MKNALLSFLFLLPFAYAQAQSIPNASFENWSITNYDIPGDWMSSNDFTVDEYGVATVTKVTGFSSTNAVRIETMQDGPGGDTIPAFISNSDDPTSGDGGVPFSQQPTAFTGYYRSSIATGDTALLVVIFKKSGIMVGGDIFKITGSQSSFTAFSYPLSVPIAPDSVIIAITSSNLLDYVGVTPGSWIELDSLKFTGPGVTQSIPNGTFENWIPVSSQNPVDWDVYGQVARTMDKYAGTYAAQMTSFDDFGSMESSDLQTEIILNQTIDTLTGYYKFITPGIDTAMVYIVLLDANNQFLTSINQNLVPVATYTQFKVPLIAGAAGAFISFSSSNYTLDPVLGSTLYLDSVSIIPGPVGVEEIATATPSITVYPNPVRVALHVAIKGHVAGTTVKIYNSRGSVVYDREFERLSGDINIPVEHLPAGMYFYDIRSGETILKDKFLKQ